MEIAPDMHAASRRPMPRSAARTPAAILHRLLLLTHPEPNSGCWLWVGSVSKKGYAKMSVPGRGTASAHRVMVELTRGVIEPGLQVDHLCGVRCCVNPDHLEAVTPLVNTRRAKNGTANRTHCRRGHPYAGANLLVRGGKRECHICVRRRWKEFYDRRHGKRTP